ncbi:ACT domain-containing protein [Desulfurococcus mucosus]|uniref:ACT domain-containing protein n=1 Tax=Desulfurococcus mucosus TaxID=2275 RepID=UPI001FDEA7F0|nr:ACT domain-containing protein [Desulfurococcus mucosus]
MEADIMQRDGVNISSIVRSIVEADPCLVEALRSGYVNYSRLSEIIAEAVREDYGMQCSASAVKMALLRSRMNTTTPSPMSKVFRVLAESSIELKTSLVIATYDSNILHDVLNAMSRLTGKTRFISVAQGVDNITVIMNKEVFDSFSKLVNHDPIWVKADVSAIVVISPVENIETPGFVSYITTLLARRKVNILQIMSAHSDTIIVVDRGDALEAFKALETAVARAREASKKAS